MLRTDDARFAHLPDWPFAPHYLEGLSALGGARLHFVDLAGDEAAARRLAAGAPRVALCLHGNPSWSYVYRKMAPVFAGAGLRVVVPDLIGFGRSDKPENEDAHSFAFHRDTLLAFIEALDLRHILLVVQDWGGLLGLTLPMAMPERFTHLLAMNTALPTGESFGAGFAAWQAYSNQNPDLAIGRMLRRGRPDMSAAEADAYDAPFPDVRYKAAVRVFPNLVPQTAQAPGAAIAREAETFWRERWQGASFLAVGARDPVLGPPAMARLQQQIRGATAPMLVAEGGHFVQEWGAPIARAALQSFGMDP